MTHQSESSLSCHTNASLTSVHEPRTMTSIMNDAVWEGICRICARMFTVHVIINTGDTVRPDSWMLMAVNYESVKGFISSLKSSHETPSVSCQLYGI